MALSGEDWARLVGVLDDRFERVYQKLDANKEAADTRMNSHSTQIGQVTALSIKAVAEHEDKHHDPVKKWGLWAAMVAVAAGLWEGMKALIKIGGDK